MLNVCSIHVDAMLKHAIETTLNHESWVGGGKFAGRLAKLDRWD